MPDGINQELINIILIALGIVFALGVVIIAVLKVVKSNRENKRIREEQANEERRQEIEEGVQEVLREIREEYLVMSRNVTYKVGHDGEIAMGRYVVKSSVTGETFFNVRLNGLVRRLEDGSVLTLGAGDTICPVSESVLLKPYVDEHINSEK